jgi:hypothetical protein
MGHFQLRKHLQRNGHYKGVTSFRKCDRSGETSPHVILEFHILNLVHRRLQLFGDYRPKNFHGQNGLVSGLLNIICGTSYGQMLNWVKKNRLKTSRRAVGTVRISPAK